MVGGGLGDRIGRIGAGDDIQHGDGVCHGSGHRAADVSV